MNTLQPPTEEYLNWQRTTEAADMGGQVQWAINMAKSLISTLQNYESAKTFTEKLKYIATAIGAVAALAACIGTIKSIVSSKIGGNKDAKK